MNEKVKEGMNEKMTVQEFKPTNERNIQRTKNKERKGERMNERTIEPSNQATSKRRSEGIVIIKERKYE